jgi:hypothetical protein
MGRSSWVPPPHHPDELDRALLALCSPEAKLPPRWVNSEKLLARAVELDVFPLVFHRLRRSPHWASGGASPEWEERFRANAARNLLLDTEQERLLNLLKTAGVPALPLKGTRLAASLYSDLALRGQVDVDIYVRPDGLPAALAALEADGYRRLTAAGLPSERLAATGDEFTSECSLEKRAGPLPVLVELHWRLLPLPARELQSACDNGALPAPLDFLYLCLQASADRWGTLKALVDLAHWVGRQPPDWNALAAAAGRLGLVRILGLTLHVLLDYFTLAVPEEILARLGPAVPARLPRGTVANPFAPLPSLGPAATHRLRWTLRERLADRLRYAAFLLRPTPRDLAVAPLPRGLGFLYWAVRWLRLAGVLDAGREREPALVGVCR